MYIYIYILESSGRASRGLEFKPGTEVEWQLAERKSWQDVYQKPHLQTPESSIVATLRKQVGVSPDIAAQRRSTVV